MNLRADEIEALIHRALAEDLPFGDLTSDLLLTDGDRSHKAEAVVKGKRLVAAGVEVAGQVFRLQDPDLDFAPLAAEGSRVEAGQLLFRVAGHARSLLAAERVALNLLQRTCGIATETRAFVDAVAHARVRILDTRKTTPGLRALEKYAVAMGGGFNHRYSLSDGILIKENHIAAVGSIRQAVTLALSRRSGHLQKVEVEVPNLNGVEEAIAAGAEMLLLDNFSPDQVEQVVRLAAGKISLEVSGGITLENIVPYAEAGPDFISIGRLTHSAPAADISLLFHGADNRPGEV